MRDPSWTDQSGTETPPDAGYQQAQPKTKAEQEWAQKAREAAESLNQEDIARGVAVFLGWAHKKAVGRQRTIGISFWKNRKQRRAQEAARRKFLKGIQREAKKRVHADLRTLSQESDDGKPPDPDSPGQAE